MDIQQYWPTIDNVLDCIKTEAEELSDATLLAVHEPMHLIKYSPTSDLKAANENDLLEHFLKVERPIPIVADAGLGKSHLIRWLHAKLKTEQIVKDEKWQIVRLPKNASLRQTLHLLLKNLDGEVFDQARKRIDEVGSNLIEDEVADLFVTFLAHRIQDIKSESLQTMQRLGRDADKTELDFLKERASISAYLPNLVADILFKSKLIKKGSYVYNIATRWVRGATEVELIKNDYELSIEDFNHILNEIEIDDLSLPGRESIRKLRLDSDAEQRSKSLIILNEAIGKATQTAFQQLFKFNNGNFQDLFKEIRAHLKKLDRTLVVLVEDLAAISAIEDVLIDCLLEEKQDNLCTLRSVIAVTSGYSGYTRRQNTIRTRARFEWQIKSNNDNQDNIPKRIVDFCSRYLNAARFGKEQLNEKINLNQWNDTLPIWSIELSETEAIQLESFGKSSKNIPLFPFNMQAILKLAKWYCSDESKNLIFNPRDILNDVLLNVLRDYRKEYLDGSFPSKLQLNENSATLVSEIQNLGLSRPKQAIALCTVWSNGTNLVSIQRDLPAGIAETFGATDLANRLKTDIPAIKPETPSTTPTTPDSPIIPTPKPTAIDELEEKLTPWLNGEQPLAPELANALRSQLYEMVDEYQPSEWNGFRNSKVYPSGTSNKYVHEVFLKSRGQYLIRVPGANNNLSECVVDFCSDSEFNQSENAAKLQRVAIAIIRYNQNNLKTSSQEWNYSKGYEDFIYYKQFAESWVPQVIKEMLKSVRFKFLIGGLDKQIMLLTGLGIRKSDAQNVLLMKRIHLESLLKTPINESYNSFRNALLEEWENTQALWFNLVAIDNIAIDTEIFAAAIRKVNKDGKETLNNELRKLKDNAVREIKPILTVIQDYIGQCNDKEEFLECLERMKKVYRSISALGLFPEGLVRRETANKDINLLAETLKWNEIKNSIKLLNSETESSEVEVLSSLDGNILNKVHKVLDFWINFEKIALYKIKQKNNTTGSHQLSTLSANISSTNSTIITNLYSLKQIGGNSTL